MDLGIKMFFARTAMPRLHIGDVMDVLPSSVTVLLGSKMVPLFICLKSIRRMRTSEDAAGPMDFFSITSDTFIHELCMFIYCTSISPREKDPASVNLLQVSSFSLKGFFLPGSKDRGCHSCQL